MSFLRLGNPDDYEVFIDNGALVLRRKSTLDEAVKREEAPPIVEYKEDAPPNVNIAAIAHKLGGIYDRAVVLNSELTELQRELNEVLNELYGLKDFLNKQADEESAE